MFNINIPKSITIAGHNVELYEPPTVYGPTDGIQFAGLAARVADNAWFGDMCRCGNDRLTNIIAEDEADTNGRKLIILKCYSCKCMFMSEYPEAGAK